ncbi:sensor histidine kinase [Paenibacillus thalictri]|uniref:histidine kinase n=1 Tax=Paenibacillus thalictri TaxID=2527873 RepID=A0A4Q9DHQ2_9BACL|nr:histidine kinase dimerization/phospho-acceptor domain-containing protein [Paenibacillus thalictri]TBL72478.1 GHKL domain-containing protein [Paenibacillus thalictri]
MATKSKNKTKQAAVFVLMSCLSLVTLILGADIVRHAGFLDKNYYFTSSPFYEQLNIHMNLFKYVYVEHRNYPGLPLQEKLSTPHVNAIRDDYFDRKRSKQHEIRNLYSSKLGDLQRQGLNEEFSRLQAEQQIADADARADKLMEQEINNFIQFQTNQYNQVAKSLDSRSNTFRFSVKNLRTDEWYSNLGGDQEMQELRNQALYALSLPVNDASSYSPFIRDLSRYFQQNRLEGEFIIPAQVSGFSQFHIDYQYYLAIRERVLKETALIAAAIAVSCALLVYMKKFPAVADEWFRRLTKLTRRIPLDLRIALAVVSAALLVELTRTNAIVQLPLQLETIGGIVVAAALAMLITLIVWDVRVLCANREELAAQWKSAFSKKLLELVKTKLASRQIIVKAALLFISTALLGIMMFGIMVGIAEGAGGLVLLCGVYLVLYLLIAGPYIVSRIRALRSVIAGAEALAAGNFNCTVLETGQGHLFRLARDLNNTKLGLMKSLESQIKSERLKSELITNVSHDLKTPLTSIVNYVGLLKDKELPRETLDSYIEVLERKTDRLKLLIDDLFEASKLTSGEVELALDNVNVSALLNQALAEYDEQLKASSCTCKVDIPNPKIYALLDGKKTWRVFENLIGNALKYAMPGTRIHVSLDETDKDVLFTIKNVSAYAIDFNAEELFERFKRADPSRHTEGSGLGLSIARSIAQLQGGRLDIDIDGDYFKAIAVFRKSAPISPSAF